MINDIVRLGYFNSLLNNGTRLMMSQSKMTITKMANKPMGKSAEINNNTAPKPHQMGMSF